MKNNKAMIQFKFLFSLIFAAFMFMFLFFFIVKTIFLYQEYAIISLYTSIVTLIDVISLKKNTASIVEITKARNFKINVKGNNIFIQVLFKRKAFPLYGKLVVTNTIESPRIYYETKPIYLPFYVGSITYLIPLERKNKENLYLLTYDDTSNYGEINELMKILFPIEGISEDLPFFKDKMSHFLRNNLKSKTLRILILTKDDGDYYAFNKVLGKNLDKIKESKYDYFWVISAKPLSNLNGYIYKIVTFEKIMSKEELVKQFEGILSPKIYTFYVPKEFLLAALMVDSPEELKDLLRRFYKKAYYSYIAYNFHKEDIEFTSVCSVYSEIDQIIDEIEKVQKGKSIYDYNNLTLGIKKYVDLISKRNSEKSHSDNPICTLY
jgi:hypothetical protein